MKNSWKCWGFGIFSCWQLWFHEKNCQKKLAEILVKMFGFCQNWIFGQKFDFSNSVKNIIFGWWSKAHLIVSWSWIPNSQFVDFQPLFLYPLIQSRKETDEVSSSGYSSSFNAEYYPVQTDTMDTEDYELYDPRIHATRTGPTRIVQPRVANKVKPREVLYPVPLLILHFKNHCMRLFTKSTNS